MSDDYLKAKTYALKRLSSKVYLTKDLRDSMMRKGFLSEDITRALSECQALGYLNDDEWLDAFMRGQISKRKGPQAIAAKLFQKGFPREVIQNVVGNLNQEDSIRDLLKTKYRNKDLSDRKEKQKVIASLARRGFRFDEVLKVMGEVVQ